MFSWHISWYDHFNLNPILEVQFYRFDNDFILVDQNFAPRFQNNPQSFKNPHKTQKFIYL